ncbi:MAG: hypothetical protein HY064_08595 [Bacteroidetes bacterium]|nr:hypothetical protein [Bacteroidota bacterium]
MSKQNHIIRKLIIEIGLPTHEEAFGIQNKLIAEYKRIILDIIEEILNRLIGVDEVIQLSRVEIDLGEIPVAHLSYDFPARIKAEMEQALSVLLYEVRNDITGNANVQIAISGEDKIIVEARRRLRAVSEFETLLYYLEFGIFPWSDDRKKKPSLREMIAIALEKFPDQLRLALQKLGTKEHVFQRLALQLQPGQSNYLAAILGCSFSSQLSPLSVQLQKLIVELSRSEKIWALKGKTIITSGEVEILLRKETLIYFSSPMSLLSHPSSSTNKNHPIVNYLFFILERAFEKYKISPGAEFTVIAQQINNPEISAVLKIFEVLLKRNNTADHYPGNSSFPKNEKKEDLILDIIKTEEKELSEAPEVEDDIYIHNAGMVILHPYLPSFFRNLGIVEGKEFVSEEAKHKAVHLLQWLVYGEQKVKETELTEHELVLNKIFCGMEIAQPVPVKRELNEKECKESETLLESIISNWPVLKNTSIHGLRTTFLQKEGRLKHEEKHWSLLIHRDSAVEVLIDRLPWGIGIIKFPWNKETIYVQW